MYHPLPEKGERSMGKPDSKIDAVFADMATPQHPGPALLVIDHDEVVYRKCYGLADLETERAIAADSSFYLGSISKQFKTRSAHRAARREGQKGDCVAHAYMLPIVTLQKYTAEMVS
jgi:CubicO group peptidase (beta-lactamase class C family)